MNRNRIVAAFFVAALTGGTALAHGGATGIVLERMEAMKSLAGTMKTLAAMMRGHVKYDADEVRAGGKTIAMHSGRALTSLFPENSIDGPSEARPEIWSNWQEFAGYARQMKLLGEGLSSAADNGPVMTSADSAAMQKSMISGSKLMGDVVIADHIASMPPDGVFTMIAKTCSGCHEKFRLKKN